MLDLTTLTQFTGTDNYYQSKISNLWYSDGARYVFQNAGTHGAYWLLDLIQFDIIQKKNTKLQEFLVVNVKDIGLITADDGNDNVLYTNQLDYIDWEKGKNIRLYIETAQCGDVQGKLIMLPSER